MVQALGAALDDTPGIDVIGSAFGEDEGVRAAGRLDFDVVVLDADLGDTACYSVTKEVAAAGPGGRVVLLGSPEPPEPHLPSFPLEPSFLPKDQTVDTLASVLLGTDRPGANQAGMDARRPTFTSLSPREREVLALLAEGMPNKLIARRLGVSLHTVRNHVQRILAKLEAHSKLEAVAKAAREGMVNYH